jgi:hypothetical protein
MSEKISRSNDTVVPNDGSYLGTRKAIAIRAKKVEEEFNAAWLAQKGLLKGNVIKLYKDKTSIGVQWQSYLDWDDSKLVEPNRVKRSLGALGRGKFPHTANAVNNAVAIAREIDNKIKADAFSWLDYPQWMPKEVRPQDEVKPESKTIAQWIEEYEAFYWLDKDKEEYRNHTNWKKGYLRYFKRIPDWEKTPSKEIFDAGCRNYPKSRKRNECCTRIKYLAQFCGLTGYDSKDFRLRSNQIEVRAKAKRELTDKEVEAWYEKFFTMTNSSGKKSQWQLWQWMYGMQAAYGFRNHETLNIFNLDEGCTSEDGRYYPSFTDAAKNPRGIIYTEGKGVKRAAFLPHPMRWIDDFNLRSVPTEYYEFQRATSKLSRLEQGKAKAMKLHSYGNFIREHGFTFTAYNLRHHFNVKSHHAGLPASIIAKTLGHTLAMNNTVYLESQGIKSCLETIKVWEVNQKNEEGEELSLERQVESLRQENEQLKALLQQLLESIKTKDKETE